MSFEKYFPIWNKLYTFQNIACYCCDNSEYSCLKQGLHFFHLVLIYAFP